MRKNAHVTQHGTYNEYQNYGCRCDACRKANSEYQRALQHAPCQKCGAPTWGRFPSHKALCTSCTHLDENLQHGTESYHSGRQCRCDECRAAAAEARKRRRHANIETTRAYDREYRRRYRENLKSEEAPT